MNFKSLKYWFLTSFCLALALLNGPTLLGHGNEKHGKKTETEQVDTLNTKAQEQVDPITGGTVTEAEHAGHIADKRKVHASISDFPHIHPLIVHFPIMLLMIAAAIQLVNIYFFRTELNWVVTVLTVIGFITAYASTYWAHPHTSGLTEHAKLVLDQHDKYAYLTIYFSGAGLLAQVLSLLVFKKKRWGIVVAALLLTGAGYSVAMTGHYGAQLVHIEGVGPQGKYLEHHH
ncbi:hypothetical protein I5M27_02615 [Adhaeribacter sp. BT258]|uniref:DUF2231 domain-containing protein n=1 Tax=Adhaeribacter terrigena TaxID=2793070 RepID=A0ABS1BXN8_9BACT|nr:hypothetical protein [Adhaeribacter terrigena]MBK0401859.1 hypothetical protein [Adhaeribacter terrigena]